MKIGLFAETISKKPKDPKATVMAEPINRKFYEADKLDEDMIEAPKRHRLNRFLLDDVQIAKKEDVDDYIKLLENVKKSLNK